MKKIDVHCHADLYSQDELRNIFQKKDFLVVGAATGYESGNNLLALAEKYDNLKVCLGIHPEMPDRFLDFERVTNQIKTNISKILAIGEIGMPWYCLRKMSSDQKQATLRDASDLLLGFMELAKELDLPVILHAIEDTASTALTALKKNGITQALFHWFEGTQQDLGEIIRGNYMISVSPDVMYNSRYEEFVDRIPLEFMTLESDGPWEYNGMRGLPSMIEDTAAYLAEKRNLGITDILTASYKNSLKLFGKHALDK